MILISSKHLGASAGILDGFLGCGFLVGRCSAVVAWQCTPSDRDTDRDSGCCKQHRQSLEVYGAFAVPVMRREGVGASLAEFRKDGEARPVDGISYRSAGKQRLSL
jgi:hypothetical protein